MQLSPGAFMLVTLMKKPTCWLLRFSQIAKVSYASQVMLARSSSYGAYSQIPPKLVSGLHPVTYFGLNQLMISLLNHENLVSKDSKGRTLLMWAVKGEQEGSRLLLEKGADTEQKCRGWDTTELHYAVWSENEAVMKLLVLDGADINAMDDDNDNEQILPRALGHGYYGKPRLF